MSEEKMKIDKIGDRFHELIIRVDELMKNKDGQKRFSNSLSRRRCSGFFILRLRK
jgi:hypothetical protein